MTATMSVETHRSNLNCFIKSFFEEGLKSGDTRQVRKDKQTLFRNFAKYCLDRKLHDFQEAVNRSIDFRTNGEQLEEIIRRVSVGDTLTSEQRVEFLANFEFTTPRVGVVNTQSYHEDMERMIREDLIDLASGTFKTGRGASGESAKRLLRTQKAYEKIINNLSEDKREEFQTKVADLENKIYLAEKKELERRAEIQSARRRLELETSRQV